MQRCIVHDARVPLGKFFSKRPWGSFPESPDIDNLEARKAVLVYMEDRVFSSFASNMIRLSVNETKWSSLLARTSALIL